MVIAAALFIASILALVYAVKTLTTTKPCRPGGEMDYVDDADLADSALLSFERWAPEMPWEISTVTTVLTGGLTVNSAASG